MGVLETELRNEDTAAGALRMERPQAISPENVKYTNKPQASSHVCRHTGKKSKVEEDDAAADMEVSELENCREHLNAILAHREPVFPAAPCTQGLNTDPYCWSMAPSDSCCCMPDFRFHGGHAARSSGAGSVTYHVRLLCTSAGDELQDGLGLQKQGEETITSLCEKIWLHQGINSGN